jgi:hydroxypyruvate isomerase
MRVHCCGAGFRAVEFGSEVVAHCEKEAVVAAKENAGVEVVNMSTPYGAPGDKGLAAVPGREADFRTTLLITLDWALALKCPRIHIMAGAFDREVQQTDPLWQRARATYISNLQFAADECSKKNVTVLIEAISVIPHYFLQHQKQGIDIIKKVARDNVKLEFDFYHAQMLDGNLCDFLTRNIDHVGHIQIAQVPYRHEPDDEGEINYPFVFQTLRSLGYRGWIGCEYIPRGKTEDGLAWAAPFLSKKD